MFWSSSPTANRAQLRVVGFRQSPDRPARRSARTRSVARRPGTRPRGSSGNRPAAGPDDSSASSGARSLSPRSRAPPPPAVTSWKCIAAPGRSARSGEAGAHQPHGQRMAGEHRHPAGVVPDQRRPAAAGSPPPHAGCRPGPGRPGGSSRLHPDQVGDPVHQHPGLPRAGPGQHQHVRLLPVVGHECAAGPGCLRLSTMVTPRLGRGLPGQFPLPRSGSQRSQELRLSDRAEVVQGRGVSRVRRRPRAPAARTPPSRGSAAPVPS